MMATLNHYLLILVLNFVITSTHRTNYYNPVDVSKKGKNACEAQRDREREEKLNVLNQTQITPKPSACSICAACAAVSFELDRVFYEKTNGKQVDLRLVCSVGFKDFRLYEVEDIYYIGRKTVNGHLVHQSESMKHLCAQHCRTFLISFTEQSLYTLWMDSNKTLFQSLCTNVPPLGACRGVLKRSKYYELQRTEGFSIWWLFKILKSILFNRRSYSKLEDEEFKILKSWVNIGYCLNPYNKKLC